MVAEQAVVFAEKNANLTACVKIPLQFPVFPIRITQEILFYSADFFMDDSLGFYVAEY